ncbi:MAG: hypothetical protein NTZ65_02745 [Candidatus Berkelbacteria bacterium]|nr:hypothetical protein [Candidatus Berkelbacteria bacterium]
MSKVEKKPLKARSYYYRVGATVLAVAILSVGFYFYIAKNRPSADTSTGIMVHAALNNFETGSQTYAPTQYVKYVGDNKYKCQEIDFWLPGVIDQGGTEANFRKYSPEIRTAVGEIATANQLVPIQIDSNIDRYADQIKSQGDTVIKQQLPKTVVLYSTKPKCSGPDSSKYGTITIPAKYQKPTAGTSPTSTSTAKVTPVPGQKCTDLVCKSLPGEAQNRAAYPQYQWFKKNIASGSYEAVNAKCEVISNISEQQYTEPAENKNCGDEPVAPSATQSASPTPTAGPTDEKVKLTVSVINQKNVGVSHAQVSTYTSDSKKTPLGTCLTNNGTTCSIEIAKSQKDIKDIYIQAEKAKKTGSITVVWSLFTEKPTYETPVKIEGLTDPETTQSQDYSAAGSDGPVAPITVSDFPTGNSTVYIEASRFSYASSPRYSGTTYTPVGGVDFTLSVITNYQEQKASYNSVFKPSVALAAGGVVCAKIFERDDGGFWAVRDSNNNLVETDVYGIPIDGGRVGNYEVDESQCSGSSSSTTSAQPSTATKSSPDSTNASSATKSNSSQKINDQSKTVQHQSDSALSKIKQSVSDAIQRSKPGYYKKSTYGTIPDNGQNSYIVIQQLPPGRYELKLSKNNFKGQTIGFDLFDKQTLKLPQIMLAPNQSAEPPSVNSVVWKSANKDIYFAKVNNQEYAYAPTAPWYGWQPSDKYNFQRPPFSDENIPNPQLGDGLPDYNGPGSSNYWGYMNQCQNQNLSVAIGPGIDKNKAGIAAALFGLLQKDTGKTFLEDSLGPGIATYFAAGAIEKSGAAFSVTKMNQNCYQNTATSSGTSVPWTTPPQCTGCAQIQATGYCEDFAGTACRCDLGCQAANPLMSALRTVAGSIFK